MDRLFLHFAMTQDLWDMVFSLFGIQWVMSRRVIDLLACWQGRLVGIGIALFGVLSLIV